MKLKQTILIPLVILGFSNALALSGTELKTEKRNIEKFLVNLGYEDYSKMMKENLAAKQFISPADPEKGEKVLTEQIKNYSVFNDSRELATQLLALINDDTMNAEEIAKDLTDFTAQMIKLAPLMPKTNYNPDATEDEVWAKAWEEADKKISQQTTAIAADLINVLFNQADEKKFVATPDAPEYADKFKEYKEARTRMSRLIKFMYTNSSLGHSAYLGKALAAGLLREDVKNGNNKFETALRQKLRPAGFYLENFVGTTLKVTDQDSTVHDVTIQNGDFILERSYGLEASQITFAARPYSTWLRPGNLRLAAKHKLLGMPGGDKFHEDDDGNESPILKAIKGLGKNITQNTTWSEVFNEVVVPVTADKIEAATHSKILNYGISHAGIAMTKTDPETKISMAWAVDVYPNAGSGGIRIMDILGQFAKDGHYMRFGVSRNDPEKFYKHVASKQTYQKAFNFHSGKQKPSETLLWPTLATEAEYNQEIADGAKDPAAWYAKVMRKSTDFIISDFLGKGLGFAYGFKNDPGQAYCSQMVLLAGLQSSSVDFQSRPDVWDPLILHMKSKGAKAVEDIDTQLRIVAPAGFMWQSDIVAADEIQVITYKYLKNEIEMAKKMFMPKYTPIDKTIAKSLKPGTPFDKHFKHNFTKAEIESMAQDEMTAWKTLVHIRTQRNTHQELYGDREDRNGRGYFGATMNFMENRKNKPAEQVEQELATDEETAVAEAEADAE